MKTVADVLGVSRSNLAERLKGKCKPRGSYLKADDAELLPAIRKLVDARPTYGYRRIAALLNRQRRAADLPVVNRKRVGVGSGYVMEWTPARRHRCAIVGLM